MGWKIVRDRVEQVCRTMGVSGTWRKAGRAEAIRALGRKLTEESGEFAENYDPAELFDLRDALDELIYLLDPHGDAAVKHAEKVKQQGKFRMHVMWSPIPNDESR